LNDEKIFNPIYATIGTRFKKRSRILLNTRSTSSPITFLFFYIVYFGPNMSKSSSPVDIFAGTVNAHVIAKHEENDPVIVNGLTAR